MRQNITISSNKTQYRLFYVMKLAVTIGCVSEIVLSLYYYGNCQYEQSQCLQKAQGRPEPTQSGVSKIYLHFVEMLEHSGKTVHSFILVVPTC